MLFESRHRPLKADVQGTSCQINLLSTIAMEQVLNLCYVIHSFKFSPRFIFGPKDEQQTEHSMDDCYEYVEFDRNKIGLKMIVTIDLQRREKLFGKITKIVYVKNKFFATVEVFEEVTFDSHFHSFIVERNILEDKTINVESIENAVPCLYEY